MKTLIIDSCLHREKSRTERLMRAFMDKHPELKEDVKVHVLEEENIPPMNEEILEKRGALLAAKVYDDPMFEMARDFAHADVILIAAPYWDMQFPALLKIALERTTVAGVTFHYTDKGPVGHCHAKLHYFTTAGGFIRDKNLGYDYLKALVSLYGITDTECHTAEGLDIVGNDVEKIMEEAIAKL